MTEGLLLLASHAALTAPCSTLMKPVPFFGGQTKFGCLLHCMEHANVHDN